MAFEITATVSWGHLDANGHMANTAYLDLSSDARFAYFSSQGFTPAEFASLRIGPVVRRDEVEYVRELHLLQQIRVNYLLAGASDDASAFIVCNEIYRPDGKLAARVTSAAGWFDLVTRKLVVPPQALADALLKLDRTENFQVLKSSVKK